MTHTVLKGALALLLASAALGTPPAAAADKPAAAAAAKPSAMAKPPAYEVKGFRSARFGQSQDQVLADIEKDFGVKAADVQHINVMADGTTALAVNQAQMAPAPGAATVTYVFGKAGLIHVNVVWLLTGDVTQVQRAGLVAAGVRLSDYFRTFSWVAGKSGANIPIGPNSVAMFLGRDFQGNAVEVSADGVAFSRTVAGKAVQSPTPAGPARLRVAYGSANETSAISTIKPGQF